MARPEQTRAQALGEQVDGRSDVYALGVVLDEMLTGTRPFSGRNATEVIAQHISALIPNVSDREPETPEALVRLVGRMLSKDPAGRPTADDLVKELTAASAADAMLTPSQVRGRRWKRRAIYPTIAGVSAGAVAVVGVRLALRLITLVASGGEGPIPRCSRRVVRCPIRSFGWHAKRGSWVGTNASGWSSSRPESPSRMPS